MSYGKSLAQTIIAAVRQEMSRYIDVYSAVVTAIDTTGDGVQLRKLGETTASTERYARLSDLYVIVDDEVLVIEIRQKAYILGKIKSGVEPVPTITVITAQAGTGATGQILSGGTDYSGEIELVAGSAALGAGNVLTFNFGQEKPDTSYNILLSPNTNATGDLQGRYNTVSRTVDGWNLNFRVAPTAGAVYRFAYFIRQSKR